MTDNNKIVFVSMLVLSAVCCAIGLTGGITVGHNEACASLHLEWVKNRCMKVTREEVK